MTRAVLMATRSDRVVGGEDRGGAGRAGILMPVSRGERELGEDSAGQGGFETLTREAVVVHADVDDVDIGWLQSRVGDGFTGDIGHHLRQRRLRPAESAVGPTDDRRC
jgi:hypothetical protein